MTSQREGFLVQTNLRILKHQPEPQIHARDYMALGAVVLLGVAVWGFAVYGIYRAVRG